MMEKHRIKVDITTRMLYASFHREHLDLKVGKDEYARILKAINHSILDIVIEGSDIALPWRLGTIGIRSMAPRYKDPMKDYGEINKLRKKYPGKNYVAYMNNEHTNGKIIKFLWLKKNGPFVNKQFYTLHFTRPKNRQLAARLKNPDIANNYYEFISWKDKLNKQRK